MHQSVTSGGKSVTEPDDPINFLKILRFYFSFFDKDDKLAKKITF